MCLPGFHLQGSRDRDRIIYVAAPRFDHRENQKHTHRAEGYHDPHCNGSGRQERPRPGRATRGRKADLRKRYERLTVREREVFLHLIRGQLNKQVAADLQITERTIKLHRANLEIELGELALEIQGSRGALAAGSDVVPDAGHWQRFALSWPEVVIGGGTPNIQKNVIAERLLGLPHDV